MPVVAVTVATVVDLSVEAASGGKQRRVLDACVDVCMWWMTRLSQCVCV